MTRLPSSMGKLSSSSVMALVAISCILIAGGLPFCVAYHYGEVQQTHFPDSSKEVYIVHLDESSRPEYLTPEERHHSILTSLHSSQDLAQESRLYSYNHVFDGFSATLTPQQAATVAAMPEVHSVFPNRALRLQTTRSWDFLGLGSEKNDSGLAKEANYGNDVIVGIIDSGIWPESLSFSDESLPPVPSRWKGTCVDGDSFLAAQHCNKKLIGARYYVKGFLSTNRTLDENSFLSARDSDGHGTHAASTLAGRYVETADVFGQAKGAARGGAPLARLAVYKACWPLCFASDILAAFDDAIQDGVDIVSLSLGSNPPQLEYYLDPLSVATFQAMRRGILSISAAGNSGPYPGSATNVEPWVITVAATSIDREFPTSIVLGNNVTYKGFNALNQHSILSDSWYPLMKGVDAAIDAEKSGNASQCIDGSIDPEKVADKIVVCETVLDYDPILKINALLNAGSVGMILIAPLVDAIVLSFPLPFALVNNETGVAIKEYIEGCTFPLGKIGATETEISSKIKAPVVARFSSRGPNALNPEIIKPDICAPGVSIIAAWSPSARINPFRADTRSVEYFIDSGTSMSTPHVAAVAALLKAAHPTWSPSAIRSAIMTTADRLDNTGWPITDFSTRGGFAGPYALGAGQINPNRAAEPGLIFNATVNDYALLLCASGYNATVLQYFMDSDFVCPKSVPLSKDFNYPSIHFMYGTKQGTSNTVQRTVTNVGKASSTYTANVIAPSGTQLTVEPKVLRFSSLDQQLNFTVTLTPKVKGAEKTGAGSNAGKTSSGAITWVDSKNKFFVNVLVVVSL